MILAWNPTFSKFNLTNILAYILIEKSLCFSMNICFYETQGTHRMTRCLFDNAISSNLVYNLTVVNFHVTNSHLQHSGLVRFAL